MKTRDIGPQYIGETIRNFKISSLLKLLLVIMMFHQMKSKIRNTHDVQLSCMKNKWCLNKAAQPCTFFTSILISKTIMVL